MIFLELLKAFDVANRRLLFVKTEALFISTALRNWVAAFLNHQQMRRK